jgi:hypothetical protein
VSISPNPEWTEPVANPQTFGDARANLEHTLQVYGDAEDDHMVLIATGNIYGPNVKTGLTMRDLRLIVRDIGAATR